MTYGLDGLPESLLRKMFDDIFVCIHCGSDDVSYASIPSYMILYDGKCDPRMPICNSCHAELPHLGERTYGLSQRDLDRFHTKHEPWKDTVTPLWAIGDGSE